MPKTLAETDQRISEKEEEIRYHESAIQTVKQQLEMAPADGRERLQRNLNRITSLLEAAKSDLKALQAARQEFSRTSTSLNPY
jgi:chromosome segregation ATPase